MRQVRCDVKFGYGRCSTDEQDVEAQRQGLLALGVDPKRIHLDRGRTGRNIKRPELEKVLAAVRPGDEIVVTKLDRFARSVVDARTLADKLFSDKVRLNINGNVYDPGDAMGKMFFTMVAMFAEFEVDLISQRTREGLAIARQKGRLKGKPPKLRPATEKHLVQLFDAGEHTVGEMADMFGVSRATVYRAVQRARAKTQAKAGLQGDAVDAS